MADISKLKKLAQELGPEALQKLSQPNLNMGGEFAAREAAPVIEKAVKAEKGIATKIMDALATPQKLASRKLADMAGLKPGDTSEENFVNLADQLGDSLGVPRDSFAGNAVKAGGVALAEVFGDPLGFIPVGKVAAGIKGLGKLGPLAAVAKVAEEGGALKKASKILQEAEAVGAKKVADNLTLQAAADAIKAKKAAEEAALLAQKDTALKNLSQGLKPAEAAPDWQKAYQKKGLRPELQNKDSLEIWNDISQAQEAAPKIKLLDKPAPSYAKIKADQLLEKQGLDNAKEMGASKADQAALAELYKRFRGGGK